MSAPVGPGPAWKALLASPRHPARELDKRTIPDGPGVYAWFRDGEPIYAGKASGRGGLRGRLRQHLGTGRDLSHSSFRRNVAEHVLAVPTSVSRQRPSVMTEEQVSGVNAFIAELQVTWVEFEEPAEAVAFERELLGEWMPPLSKR